MSRLNITLLGALHFVLLLFAQVLLFDNVRLFGYVNPMIYIWFVLMLPYKTPHWAVLILAFLMGLCVDVLSFGQGFHAVTLTFIGFIRPFVLNFYTGNRDIAPYQRPTLSDMGFMQFAFYISLLVIIHHLLFFSLDVFRFDEIFPFLLRLFLSTVSTVVIILLCDFLFLRKRE
ncbi:MAG: rod shape-determining protein MreD [Bacteroidales bacterium]|jgi:hypothetical protein|nr:rod shape-determining protein MreD [Bacteroidales bacterium]